MSSFFHFCSSLCCVSLQPAVTICSLCISFSIVVIYCHFSLIMWLIVCFICICLQCLLLGSRLFYYHNGFMALFPGPLGWASARRELLEFMVQRKINRGRHTNHPAGRHSIRTNQCPPPPSPIFYRPDALLSAQPTASKHWRQLVHSD